MRNFRLYQGAVAITAGTMALLTPLMVSAQDDASQGIVRITDQHPGGPVAPVPDSHFSGSHAYPASPHGGHPSGEVIYGGDSMAPYLSDNGHYGHCPECGGCPECVVHEGKPVEMTGCAPVDFLKMQCMKLRSCCTRQHLQRKAQRECRNCGQCQTCGRQGAGYGSQYCEDCQRRKQEEDANDVRRSDSYSMVYAVNPEYFDERDGRIFAAEGYGVPMAVPLAPNVRHTYNYGWGVPSSRRTPISRFVPDVRYIRR